MGEPDAHRAVERTNRRLVVAAVAFLLSLTVLMGAGVAAGLSLVADTRDAAASGRALVARQRQDDKERAAVEAAGEEERRRVIDDSIARINEAMAAGLAAHDLNAHDDHEDLRRILAARSAPLPARPPVTAPPPAPAARSAPAPAPPAPAPTAAAPAATTTTRPPTTSCPKLPNGKCRP